MLSIVAAGFDNARAEHLETSPRGLRLSIHAVNFFESWLEGNDDYADRTCYTYGCLSLNSVQNLLYVIVLGIPLFLIFIPLPYIVFYYTLSVFSTKFFCFFRQKKRLLFRKTVHRNPRTIHGRIPTVHRS